MVLKSGFVVLSTRFVFRIHVGSNVFRVGEALSHLFLGGGREERERRRGVAVTYTYRVLRASGTQDGRVEALL